MDQRSSIQVFVVFYFLRIPLCGQIRTQWIEAISLIQEFEPSTYYSLCQAHFSDDELERSGSKVILKEGAVPNQFILARRSGTKRKIEKNDNDNVEVEEIMKSSQEVHQKSNEVPADSQSEQTIGYYKERCLKQDIEINSLKDSIDVLRKRISEKNARMKNLENQLRYYKREMEKHNNKIIQDSLEADVVRTNGNNREIIECLLGKKQVKYSKAIRSFSITMHMRSPAAYNFLRKKFHFNLPHESSIKKWFANSTCNGEPGIQMECLQTLANLLSEYEEANKSLYCSLSFDEMAIKQHIQWSDAKKKFLGYATYGDEANLTHQPIATQAIVFLVTAINATFSIPAAYHFITSLKKNEKKKLILEVVSALTNIGIVIVNITFDGLSTNLSTCRELGACFDVENMRPFFPNPVNGQNIYVILDACHMMKLWRNTIANGNKLIDESGQMIDWVYFERLEQCRIKNEFVTHKLTKQHINWDKDKMKVKLAAQTLSRSVSNSFLFLMNNGTKGFEECAGTALYARHANDLFDIFNSNIAKNGKNDERTNEVEGINSFKHEILNEWNKDRIFHFFDVVSKYIKSLKLDSQRIVASRNSTGYVGFLINMHSLKLIFNDYIEPKLLEQIPTMRLSQDFLECFFGRLRSLLGSNNQPTVEQFLGAFRKLLVDSELTSSPFSNCIDRLTILSVSSRKNNSQLVETQQSEEENVLIEYLQQIRDQDYLLDAFQHSTVTYLAGIIENKILKLAYFNCEDCDKVLLENDITQCNFISSNKVRVPCKSTVDICIVASKYIKVYQNKRNISYDLLINTILQTIDFDKIYLKSKEHEAGHMYYLVGFIIQEFVRLKFTYIAKNVNLDKQNFLRSKYKHIIKELGQ